jgi:hypothetical protein
MMRHSERIGNGMAFDENAVLAALVFFTALALILALLR